MSSKASMTLETMITQAEGLEEAVLDGQIVMMSVDKGKYYTLDSVASRIWPMLAQPRTVRQICDELLDHYDVEREKGEREVLEFVADLERCEVIQIVKA